VVATGTGDGHAIASAITAGATSKVLGNSDLLSLGGDQGIDILSATTAVDRIVDEDARNKT